ncbi:MAG: D-galactarate dehydratase [Desulfarculus sp.]|jgi:altronate dehydratase|nr:MAG: D-galactarate dehydratase [Desulfarculus sp.]
MSEKRALALHPQDNLAVAAQDIAAGDPVRVVYKDGATQQIKAVEAVPFGFKIALADIAQGAELLKYGQVIGCASRPITAGQQIHVHNAQGQRA